MWLYNNAGLEYAAIGEHEIALGWLTNGLELAVRTGDPERLVGQLRALRAESLAALGRQPDRLQTAEPGVREAPRQPDDIVVVGEPAQQRRPQVAGGSGDCDAHEWLLGEGRERRGDPSGRLP